MKSACVKIRRARPLLGTFVEISASGLAEDALHAAVDGAFAAVERVHRLMSPCDPRSDVSRLNACAPGARIALHAWTQRVLETATKLRKMSNGVFDVAVCKRPCWRD